MAEPIVVGNGATRSSRRVLLLAGAAAVLVLAVVVLPGLLFGAEDTADPFASPVSTATTTTTVVVDDPPGETFELFTDKDPFRPLVAVGGPASDPSSPAQPDAPPPAPPPDDGGFPFPIDDGATGGQPSPEGEGTDGGTTTTAPPGPPPRQPDRVSLLEVYTDPGGQVVGSIRVNDVTHQVAEGDEFSGSYRVLDLDIGTRCAQLLFGDDRFGLCEGEETLK